MRGTAHYCKESGNREDTFKKACNRQFQLHPVGSCLVYFQRYQT